MLGSAVRTFIESLRTTPLLSEPGVGHPLWKEVEVGEGSAVMKFIESLLATHHLEPTLAEGNRKLLAISPPFGLQLAAPPMTDHAARGWVVINVGGISMFVPPGWTLVEQDSGVIPMVGLVSPGNDQYVELRFIRDALRRPGIAPPIRITWPAASGRPATQRFTELPGTSRAVPTGVESSRIAKRQGCFSRVRGQRPPPSRRRAGWRGAPAYGP